MSMYGSQKGINSNRKGSARSDVTGGGNYQYTRSEAGQGGGNGYGPADPFMDAYSYTFSSGGGAGGSGQGGSGLHQKAMILQEQCQEFLRKAEHAMQTGGDAERYMAMARETIDQLKGCASQLRQIGQPNDNVVRSVEVCRDQLKGVHMAISETLHRRRKSTRGNSGVWEEPGRTYVDAMGWIGQQKRLIETSPWGDDQETLQQQLVKHQMFHSSIQRSDEMDRARDELHQNGDKASLNALDQEWDSLQKMSFSRSEWLQELQLIIEDISKEIMWVNYREEEELVFDWGERNIDLYIPKKQESYSQLMSALEGKERDLNRLKVKVDVALKNNHPASDKIEAYMDTLQTQWSWLLQITKCIHVHLKENAAYSQFFKEANETYGALQKEHETIRKKFTCDKDTSLDSLLALLAELEKEKEKILENKRQVQHLVNASKSIVRLKPRNPEEKSSSTVIVRALCDFKQDQKVICKDNEGILKDNSQRSKWQVTGPGGLDMLVPSVCLLVPPPNPISISMAKKNDQYYEAILSIWNQLYINIKSLISWQYCCMDIENINSLTVAMLSRMSSEEYRSLIKRLETHYAEFRVNSHGSQMIEEEDLMTIESQYNGAQNHYEQLVVQLPSYTQYASTDYAVQLQNIEPQKVEPKWQLVHQPMYLIQQPSHQVVIQEEQQIRMERMERMREVEEEEERRRVEIRRLEENRWMEEEASKREEALRLEEEMRQREQAKRWEEERRRTEEAARKREEAMRLEEEVRKREKAMKREEEKRRMAEAQRLEEEVRLREEKRKIEEAKRKVELKKVEVKKDHVIKKEAVRTIKAESVKRKTSSSAFSSSSSSSSFHGSSSRSLMELRTLRTRMESAEGALNQHIHISLGDDKVRECGLRITELETIQRDIDDIQGDILRIKDMILMEVEGMADADKAQFLRSDIGGITQRLGVLDSSLSAYLQRLRALRNLLESVSHGEDIVKVHEARLTEKDTTSLSPGEVEDYIMYLKNMKVELDQKRDVFDSMEAEIEKANNWNSQVGDSSLRCDMTLATYSELVGQLTNRWRRIHTQIDCRMKDLEFYVPQLQQYKKDSTSLDEWINSTQKRQKALQSTKIEDLETVILHISQQKALNSEIKEKRRTLDSVLTESGDCVSSIKDYESDLAAYGSGLESLLNIPIKRTILTSPSTELNQEAVEMQTRYMELFTLSGDYYTYLGAMQKNMEELKIRNTRIDLLEEELRLLKGSTESNTTKNRQLQDALARYQLELSNSKEQLLSVENGNEDESRKRRLAEDRYNKQKEEYEILLRRAEKNMTDKEREAEQLRQRLADESARVRELQLETSKVRAVCIAEMKSLKLSYESQIQASHADIELLTAQWEEAATEQKLQCDRMEAEKKDLQEELTRHWLSIGEAEEGRRRAEQQALNQLSVIAEEGRQRRELEEQLESLIRQREADDARHRVELVELKKTLEEKSAQVAYVTHSLSEETRRRTTIEEGQNVLEETLAKLHMELASSSVSIAGLKECEEGLERMHFEIERQVSERSRAEQNIIRLQGRIKDLQSVRDALESQVEVLRKSNQEEVNKRKMIETELEQTTITIREYSSNLNLLLKSQEKATTAEKRVEEELLRLKGELDQSLRQNKTSSEHLSKLSFELMALQQNLLQEQAFVKEANLCKENLYKSIEEKSEALNQNSVELQKWKENTETQTKERVRLEEVLLVVSHERDELLRSKLGNDEELVTQVSALEHQLQSSNSRSLDYKHLVTELSTEREKFKLEIEKTQKQSIETTEDLERIKLSLESECHIKQRLQEENDRLKNEFRLLKDKYDSKESQTRQHDSDKDRFEQEINDLKAATGHMIDPRLNLKLTVEEACDQGLVDENDRQRLLAAEAAAVGYHDPGTGQPLSAFQAMKKGLIDKSTALRLLQAQECTGGILDPTLSVFLPKDIAIERDLINEDIYRALNQRPELYMDPETELGASYISLKRRCQKEPNTGLLLLPVSKKLDPSKLVFDGVRKPVTAKQLNDCGVLDKPMLDQLLKGEISVQDVSVDKKIILKGTGPIAGVIIASAKGTVSLSGPLSKMSLSEAKEKDLLPLDCADLLLDAQAATGHMIDPITNQKLTVEEACDQGLVAENDRQRLLAAEAAAVGYHDRGTGKPLSAFQAMKKGLIDNNTALRLIQAQESTGGFLDPILSVFVPKDIAYERDLINEQMDKALNQRPALYLDPTTEQGASYESLKRRCKTEPNTGLLLLPVPQRLDPSNLVFDGVRKPVTAKQLLDCGVIDKPTFKELCTGEKTVSEVSTDKIVSLKGNGPIAAVIVGNQVKMSFAEAKKQGLVPPESANMLLEAQAATGHIIDSRTNQNLTVEEACDKGVVAREDRDRLLAAEAAAIGYYDRRTAKHISVFEAMKKGIVDEKTALTLLQAQESAGGILDPVKSVFLPKDTAIKHKLLDEELKHALNQQPEYYIDPETEMGVPYEVLKRRCKTESHTGLILLPISEKQDPSLIIFDGVRKPVNAQQLLDCGVLDKPTFKELVKGDKTVPQVSLIKRDSLKGTGCISGVIDGKVGKMSFDDAKKQGLIPIDSANKLLEAQAATGHIIDPGTNKKLTVVEACDKGVVAKEDRERLIAAEFAAIGYTDRSTSKPLSVFEAMKKGLVDKKTALTLLQAQESAGGILDPVNSIFLPRDIAVKRKLIDEELRRSLIQQPECYVDPDTEKDVTYESLKRRCKTEYDTGLLLLPISGRQDPNKLIFDGVRKPVTAQQLLDCGVLDKPTFNQLLTKEKTIPDVSKDKKTSLKGTGAIAAVIAGDHGKISFAEAKKQGLIPTDSANKLMEAQAATGHIIDPETNTKLTVEEACVKGVVAKEDRERLLAAESAAIGYNDRTTAKPLSVFEALNKGIVDKKTALTLLQAQESAGGILDPVNSVFLPRDTAIKGKLIDEELKRSLNQQPECYIDPDTEKDVTYESLKRRCKTEYDTGLLLLPVSGKQDPNKIIFDGVRKPVTAQQLLDCGVLDKPTFNQLLNKEKTIPDVSKDKKISLKGTGAIAAVIAGDYGKMSFAEAKKQGLIPTDSANKLMEAQAATGHIIDPETNKKLTVVEACDKGVVAKEDRERLIAAEFAAIGYTDRSTSKPLSVFEAMKKGLVDKKTALTLLQAQESAGGVLDPVNSIFLPRDIAVKRKLIDEALKRSLIQQPECYVDPDTEKCVTYESLKRRCKTEPETGLLLLPISETQDPKKLIFDGIRKPVTAQQLLDCEVLDKPTLNQLLTKEKTIPEVSTAKRVILKGTGAIAAVIAGDRGKMSFAEAKKQGLIPIDSANKLLEAQAATGHIIDPGTNKKLTVVEACDKGVVAKEDRERLIAAEFAAIGYTDRSTSKPLSVFEAMKKGLVDKKTALTLLQAQESAGGILDPVNSIFLPRDIAVKRKLIDEELRRSLIQQPECYVDPDTEKCVTYESLKRRCKTEPETGLLLLPISETQDPNKLIFDGIRKPVTAQQLLDCEVLDKPTLNQLLTKEKTIPEVSTAKRVILKGTGAIAAVIAGDRGKMSFAEAKKQGLIPIDSANKLLEAQAATGHIIDPGTNKKLTVVEACDKGVVAKEDRERLLAAEFAAIGYTDRSTSKPLSLFEAMKKGLVDKKTALTLLQAQESAGGILDPVNSIFLPRDIAVKRKLIDEELKRSLIQQPECYVDPDTEKCVTYESLKRRCKTEPETGLLLLPISETQDPKKLIFDGIRKPVTAQQLLDCEVLDKPTLNQLLTKEKTIPEVSTAKRVILKGTGAIAAVIAGDRGKMSFAEAKKQGLIPIDSANKLLEAQAATGHIIDPGTNKKLTVVEACDKGVVAKEDRERLIAAEFAAIGYNDRSTSKPLSLFEAMKKGLVDKKTALTLLQAQESAGGILDPVNSIFLPRDIAVKRKLIDEELKRSLIQQPECYVDPDTEKCVTYESLKRRCKTEPETGLLLLPISETQDPKKLIFDGIRKPVTAQQLLDCEVLDKPTLNQTFDEGENDSREAKKQGLIPIDSANKLLEAQAATGHIIDPGTNKKLTVVEACDKGVVAKEDRERLLAAEFAAIGYTDRSTSKPLSLFEAMKKGLVDKKTALTLLQAQESAGGILDPVNSIFLPRDIAVKRKLIDEELKRSLIQQPECYVDPDTEKCVTYESLKRRCKTEPETGLLLLPISETQDPKKLIFDGIRKPVTAQQLLDCEVLDKPTLNQTFDEGENDSREAKKQGLIPIDSANKLLEAQAATGHIIDPETNKKLTVVEACDKGVVAKEDRERLLAAEFAAIGYTDRSTSKPLSVFEAMKKGLVDKKTALTLLQAQESAGGILDPVNSIFLPRDIAVKRKLIDEELKRSLIQQPECYVDPDTEKCVTYESLKRRCKTEPETGLLLLPISETQDPKKLIFDGIRKPVTAQQLLDCEVLDKPTLNQLLTKEKTIPEVSTAKRVILKGTGAIAAVIAGDRGKMSFAEAKKQGLIPIDSANKLLEAQAATGHIIDPGTNKKLTVVEACDKGVVAKEDRERLIAAEFAAIGYTDRSTSKPLSVFEAMKKGLVDKKTALTLLQAQESAGGILDPVNSIFLPRDIAVKRKLIDEELRRSLIQQPECYVDPDTEKCVTYESLKRRCKTRTGNRSSASAYL
ncbi:unnamed protein product [Boreogadus saida]